MSKKIIVLGLLLGMFTVLLFSAFATAKTSQYGATVYSTTADRIRGEDGDKFKIVHSTTVDPVTGLGQDTKWCAL